MVVLQSLALLPCYLPVSHKAVASISASTYNAKSIGISSSNSSSSYCSRSSSGNAFCNNTEHRSNFLKKSVLNAVSHCVSAYCYS
eukprot:12726-Heterococcus_DN1.PRE.1